MNQGRREASSTPPPPQRARVAVLIPCFNDGAWVGEAVGSVGEDEPVEVIVIDDGSTEPATIEALAELERAGVRVLRLAENRGLPAARNAGLEAASAPYAFPLDADDLTVAGALAKLADALDRSPELAVAYTDIEELTPGGGTLVRRTPRELDPFRLAYVNEMPLGALYRRDLVRSLGGWQNPDPQLPGYEDWDLWMTLVERGARAAHLDDPPFAYRYRLSEPSRMTSATRQRHPQLYAALRARHPALFGRLAEHRAASSLGPARKALYPLVYGGRRRLGVERRLKRALDAAGIWTRRG